MLGLIATLNDSFSEAAGLLNQALADTADDDFAFRTPVLLMLSFALVNAGQGEEALHRVGQAVDEASRLADTQPLSWALGMRAMLGFIAGHGFDQAGIQKAVELDHRQSDISVAFRPSIQDALLSAWTGHLEHAHEQMLSVRRRCLEQGEESELIFVDFHTVLIEAWRGSFATAALIAEDATERASQLGGDLPLSLALTNQVVLAAYAGRDQETRRNVGQALAASARCGSRRLGEWPVTMLGFLEVSLGNYQAALTTLEPLLARLNAAPGRPRSSPRRLCLTPLRR